jgi:hypothetical protein
MNVVFFLGPIYGFVGVLLAYYARPLSIRYNAWTTRLRERHPNLNPPPTPEWRARNTKIMTVYFRVAGLFLLLLSLFTLLHLMGSAAKPH